MAKAAILGFGTVGSGVAEVLMMNAREIERRAGQPLELKSIVEVRDFTGTPWESYMVKDFAVVENDPEITVVAETIGGTGLAYAFTKRALEAGKNVVTSNKALVAAHGAELLEIARAHGVRYLFEASVGGGIPILRPLTQALTAERIESIYGILNGTTNYILTRMDNGAAFEEALAEAQQMGYAERDPSADVDGPDAARKITILANLAWGKGLDPDALPMRGIRDITREDVALAKAAGYAVKLIGKACTVDGTICAFVEPQLLSQADPMAHIDGVTNVVAVEGNAVGRALFCGPGAGKLPTASAVVSDMVEVISRPAAPICWTAPVPGDVSAKEAYLALPSAFFVHMNAEAAFPIEGSVRVECPDCGDYAMITPVLPAAEVFSALEKQPGVCSIMRIVPFRS